jgi:hypothetical protein
MCISDGLDRLPVLQQELPIEPINRDSRESAQAATNPFGSINSSIACSRN